MILWNSVSTIKSVLGRVGNSCVLVLCLCCEMVASQQVVDTRLMLYKYMILCKLCGHRPMNNIVGCRGESRGVHGAPNALLVPCLDRYP